MNTIQACVSRRLLRKADRLFTGTVDGRMIELLQNARRAGATHVRIHVEGGWVTVHDDGRGVEDFQQLLNMGGRGWADEIEVAEDPAGVGLFGLAPRETVIMSGENQIRLQKEHWVGELVPIQSCDPPVRGTIIRFKAEDTDEAKAWASVDRVYPYAVFSGMTITTDNGVVEPVDFLPGDHVFSHPELGIIVEVSAYGDWPEPQRRVYERVKQGWGYGRKVMLNFHGQIVLDEFRDVDTGDQQLCYLIDMTGAPTDLRMMLPARTRIVENEAYRQLKQALVLDTFRYIERRGAHRLPFKEWERAVSLGIQLPEATPTYKVGLIHEVDSPTPPELAEPPGFSIEQGCLGPDDYTIEKAAHLFACYADQSGFDKRFVPIDVHRRFAGYSWYQALPHVERIDIDVPERALHHTWIACGQLICVARIACQVRLSDGTVFRSDVPVMTDAEDDYKLYVTPTARSVLDVEQAWSLLGGFEDEGDLYQTQEERFGDEWDRFWAAVDGPDEAARTAIIDVIDRHLGVEWQFVTATRRDGKVFVQVDESRSRELLPDARQRTGSVTA